MTIKTVKTTVEEVELTLPIFKKSKYNIEYFAIISEGIYHKIYKMDNFVNVQTVTGQDPLKQYFDFEDCTEEEFMEAWESGLKSMSLKQSITEKNILSCQIY